MAADAEIGRAGYADVRKQPTEILDLGQLQTAPAI
jgi:hypothetical protein